MTTETLPNKQINMTFKNLLTRIENKILTITINRPEKLNALNTNMVLEIGQAIKWATENPDVRGIIITGAGKESFVSGADITEFMGKTPEDGMAMARLGQATFKSIENCPKPVIAAVNGYALGGGCELAMSCHLRLASENATFGQPEVSIGVIAGYGGTQNLIQCIGKTKAMELHLTGDWITAEQALKFGLVNYVTTQEQLIPKCEEILKKIITKSPKAVSGAIVAMNAFFRHGVDGFQVEVNEFGKCFSYEDVKEGTAAFIEKRKPNFSGK
jgi:enoyl-CoA hydratase